MAEEITHYRFQATGQGDVLSAYATIESRAQQHARNVNRTARRADKGTVDDTKKAQQERIKALEQAERTRERRVKAAGDRDVRALERRLNQEVRAEERAAQQKLRVQQRMQAQAERLKLRERDKGRDRMLSGMRGGFHGAWNFARGGVALGIAGGLAVGGLAMRQGLQTDDLARDIAIAGRKPGEAAVDPNKIRKQLEATAMSHVGLKAADVGAGLRAFIGKTGNLAAGQELLNTFASTASASGASVEDVAAAGASLFNKFGITSPEQMQQAMATMVGQGKSGEFEIKDAAALYDRLTAAAGSFGIGKGVGAMTQLGGLTQLARGSKGSAESAATAVEGMFRQFTSKQGDLRAMGINVFDEKTGAARNISDLLLETISKAGGKNMATKKEKLQSIFGDEGKGVVDQLLASYTDALVAGIDPLQAMKDRIEKATNATDTWADIQQERAMREQSSSAKLTAAWESIKASVMDVAGPALAMLADTIKDLVANGGAEAFGAAMKLAVEAIGFFVNMAEKAAIALGLIKQPQADLVGSEKELRGKADAALEALAPGAERAMAKRISMGQSAADAAETVGKQYGVDPKTLITQEQREKYGAFVQADAKHKRTLDALTITHGEGPQSKGEFFDVVKGSFADENKGGWSEKAKAMMALGAGTGASPQATIWEHLKGGGDWESLTTKSMSPELVKALSATHGNLAGRSEGEKERIDAGASFDEAGAAAMQLGVTFATLQGIATSLGAELGKVNVRADIDG